MEEVNFWPKIFCQECDQECFCWLPEVNWRWVEALWSAGNARLCCFCVMCFFITRNASQEFFLDAVKQKKKRGATNCKVDQSFSLLRLAALAVELNLF